MINRRYRAIERNSENNPLTGGAHIGVSSVADPDPGSGAFFPPGSGIIVNFVKFVATNKGMTTNFFSPLSFFAVFGSGIRDNIPDPQHWV